MNKYLEWARREPSVRQMVVTIALGGSVFLAGLPLLIAVIGRWLDRALGLPRVNGGIAVDIAAVLLIVAGGSFAIWAVLAEARIGHGTPLPMVPTQRLVAVPPFTYCRNPMVLGTILAYLGLSVLLGSISAITLVLLFATLVLSYVKVFEEKELEARFGADYLEYKRTTPFLLPRLTTQP